MPCFPTADLEMEPEKCVPRLEQIRCSDSFRLAPRSAQELHRHVQKLIGCLCEDRVLDVAVARADRYCGAP